MSLILSGTNGVSDVDGSAATPAIRGTDANTGIFFPAADTIAFSEGGVEAMRLDSSANLQFNSGYGSVATAYACRAWVNFNGTGTPAIRASGNVTSITDNGVGLYTLNFTNALSNTDYAIMGTANNTNSTWGAVVCLAGDAAQSPIKSTTQAKIFVNYTGGAVDVEQVNAAVFR